MYNDNEYDKSLSVRNLLLKIFLILIIIVLLIWLVPKFLSYNKKGKNIKKTEVVETTKISKESMKKLEEAGLKYFNDDNIPTNDNESKKVYLKELKENKLVGSIKNNSTVCDINKSYVKLTKKSDDYILKTYLTCGNEKKYELINVGKYDYCDSTLLCRAEENKDTQSNETDGNNSVEDNTINDSDNTSKNTGKVLSEFSKWQDYTRTSCDTKEVTCDINDTNCLEEVKLYSRKEQVGVKTVPTTTQHTAIKKIAMESKSVCSNYNYISISGVMFRTKGDYAEILNINKKTTSNWTYRGQISTTSEPVFGGNEYYKYVGTQNGVHYYDSYKYNYSMEKVTSTVSATNCGQVQNRLISFYTVYKQQETYNLTESIYATACYKSIRTRTYQ